MFRLEGKVMSRGGGGSIVITSSGAGINGTPDMSAYGISKHAVIGLMRTAALEGAPMGIRANTVNPAPIETRMMRSIEEMRVASMDDPAVTVDVVNRPLHRACRWDGTGRQRKWRN